MLDTASQLLRLGSRAPNRIDAAWGVLAVACLGVMIASPTWETIPFHVIWITLTLLYGFRVWSLPTTAAILGGVMLATGASIFADAFDGIQLWGELFEVPLMAAMFLAMVWHARRRVQALKTVQALAEERAALLEQQERLLQNVSHELRTPVTIARGHLELLQRSFDTDRPELTVAFEELQRIEHIVDRVLLLARVERADWVSRSPIDLVPFLEDVFMRWSEVARRAWHLGEIAELSIDADETWVRAALDALIENAVQYTDEYARIELGAFRAGGEVVLTVTDAGPGISADAQERIFERFARTDASRSRRLGGSGLGLPIVAAIARAHSGSCAVRSAEGAGSVFELRLPISWPGAPAREEPLACGRSRSRSPWPDLLESIRDRALPQVPPADVR
jgi:signal transduction histidine kinase